MTATIHRTRCRGIGARGELRLGWVGAQAVRGGQTDAAGWGFLWLAADASSFSLSRAKLLAVLSQSASLGDRTKGLNGRFPALAFKMNPNLREVRTPLAVVLQLEPLRIEYESQRRHTECRRPYGASSLSPVSLQSRAQPALLGWLPYALAP